MQNLHSFLRQLFPEKENTINRPIPQEVSKKNIMRDF